MQRALTHGQKDLDHKSLQPADGIPHSNQTGLDQAISPSS